MAEKPEIYTRGHGIFESLLAHYRAEQANRLIPSRVREGRILDVGCGSFPYFLSHTYFREKFAIDQLNPAVDHPRIKWHQADLNVHPILPFDRQFFAAVTLLAVVEHLNPDSMVSVFREIYRVLEPGGVVVLTTPAAWSDGILRAMARINLVSAEEINEHKFGYTLPLLGWYFGAAGFAMRKMRFGYFEMMLNLWAVAEK